LSLVLKIIKSIKLKNLKMKKLLLSVSLFALLNVFAFAQTTTTTNPNGPRMKFETLDVDYGNIDQNSEPFRSVKFTNVGKEPLIIKSATGNCGCTVPTWPREAVNPGESGEMKIRYATERVGQINKKVTVTTNEDEGANVHVLNVKGNINAVETPQGVPATNTTILNSKK
jgi:hypothetical protein